MDDARNRQVVKDELAKRGFGSGHATWNLASKPEVVAVVLAVAEVLAKKVALGGSRGLDAKPRPSGRG